MRGRLWIKNSYQLRTVINKKGVIKTSDIVIVGIFSLLGTFGGILAGSRLTAYRLEQLEKKVDKHNSVIERTYKCEARLDVLENEHEILRSDNK